LYGVLTGGFSNYNYAINSDENPVEAFHMDFNIGQINAKADFSYFPNSRHTLNAGISTTHYDVSPGSMKPLGNESIVSTDIIPDEQGMESAVYVNENFEVSEKLSLYVGLRYSYYQYLGPADAYMYAEGLPRQKGNIIDTVHYPSGKTIRSCHGAESRASIRYMVSKNASVKVIYNRMRQYIQMLPNTVSINPTDIWKLSDAYIRPQVGDQISFGFYQYLKGNTIEASVETYYKQTENVTDYKNGAVILMNHHLETDVTDAFGKAYGLELMVKKVSGKLNGWVSYAYSRSFVRMKGAFEDETVNEGSYYPANHDKPHAVNFIGNYKFNRRFNFSLNVIYSTGRPITLPAGRYEVDGIPRICYTNRNQERVPDYFRSDISINVEGNHKVRKLAHSSWTFAIYNLLGRANPYSVYFVSEKGRIAGYKLSIFARPIPTITYNFKS
jgi:outer membrane receptor protein involved in Fe transport